jgi:hypothetical protein
MKIVATEDSITFTMFFSVIVTAIIAVGWRALKEKRALKGQTDISMSIPQKVGFTMLLLPSLGFVVYWWLSVDLWLGLIIIGIISYITLAASLMTREN